jgi:small subunit ribosomal protein S6
MERRQHMRQYELYLVIDSESEDHEISGAIERVTELISQGDGKTPGEVIKVDPRGKRRLAFPIKRKLESQDVIVSFQAPPQTLPDVERYLKLNEQVLRYLIVRTDED